MQEHGTNTKIHIESALNGGRNQTRAAFFDTSEVQAVLKDRIRCGFGSLKCGTGSAAVLPNHRLSTKRPGPTGADRCGIGSLKCGTGSAAVLPNHRLSTKRPGPTGTDRCGIGSLKCGTGSAAVLPNHRLSTKRPGPTGAGRCGIGSLKCGMGSPCRDRINTEQRSQTPLAQGWCGIGAPRHAAWQRCSSVLCCGAP